MRFIFLLSILVLLMIFSLFFPNLPFWPWFHKDLNDLEKLKLENESLKAQLKELGIKNNELRDGYLVLKIYSTYPFNDKHIFTVAAGRKKNIEDSMPVLVAPNVLLGKVIKVFSNYSEVKSIFSADWQLPVKIGDESADGLLVGGPDPKVTMIAADKDVNVGDDIYSAGKDFPYGLKVGKVKNIKRDESGFFKEAIVELPYEFNNLLEVLVLQNDNW